jgi:alpha-mannosidase
MEREPAAIHLVPHFHYDPVWIEDQRTYTNQAFELVKQYLEACRKDPGYHIILSEMDYLRPFLAVHSEQRQFVLELVAAGRVCTGGSYSQPNEMSIQGEPLIRNLLYGRLFHEGIAGAKPTVYLPLDVFGHCIQLPQIASTAGYKAVVWSKDIVGALPLCFALAPDGTSLLQKHEHYWYYPETFEEFLDTIVNGLENQASLGLNHDLRLLGMDMAPPRAWLSGKLEELARRDPSIVVGTPEKYLVAVAPGLQAHRPAIPVSGRDLSFFHGGTLVTRAELKIANRLAENGVLNAERWATLAALLGAIYPDAALDKAWRQVLFGQHHDGITGCLSDIPFLDLLVTYREALELSAEVENRSLQYIAGRVDTASARRAPREGAALIVFNPLGWERTDVCRARVKLNGALAAGFRLLNENGREVPCQLAAASPAGEEPWGDIVFVAAGVPSLGYQVYYLAPAAALPPSPAFAEQADAKIENEALSVTADPARGGCLSSIYAKALKKEFINKALGCANEVIALSEKVDRESAPWELFTTGGVLGASSSPARVEVLEGPVLSQLRSTTSLPDRCELVQEVTLYRGLPRADLRTTVVGYRGLHELLALAFPLDLAGAAATFEDRFATVVRRSSLGKFDFRTFWHQNLSKCGLGAAQNWVDVGPAPSLHIMSGSRAVAAFALAPCVIVTSRDPRDRAAARVLMTALLSRGATCSHRLDSDDPEGDMAACVFRFSLGRRNAYSAKLLEANPQAAARLTEITATQPWGGVVLRRPDPQGEWPDVPVFIADTGDPGGLAKLSELLASAVRGDDLRIAESQDFSGLATATEDAGIALINTGSIAASLENDGTLVAPLFHTSSWSTHRWGEGRLDRFFVPEHRTHIFEHSLLPHAGDWRGFDSAQPRPAPSAVEGRRGEVVRTGYEVNSPLRAVQAAIQPGVLPTSFSLVSIDAPDVVVAAVKPLGNPLAEHKATEHSQPADAILVRAYETEGRAVTAGIRFPASPEAAWTTDLMESKGNDVEIARPRWGRPVEVKLDIPACGIASLAVKLSALAQQGPPRELGPSTEPYSPVHARYWDHNLGPAPIGNLPLSLWLRGEVPIGQTTRFSLGVNNETQDREIAGTVSMIAPTEWTMIPRQIPYRIAPNNSAVYEIMVVVPPDAQPCWIRALTSQGDCAIQDVMPVGTVRPLAARLRRAADGFTVAISNPNPDYVEGHVSLITPMETWGEVVRGYGLCQVSPLLIPFRLEAGEEREFRFAVAERGRPTPPEGGAPASAEAAWAIARVAWYGNVTYVQETP